MAFLKRNKKEVKPEPVKAAPAKAAPIKAEVKPEPKVEPVYVQPKVEAAKAEPKAQKNFLRKFDYKVVVLPGSAPDAEKEERLDTLGAEGWELVGVNGEQCIFKRLFS